jgi:signal transduction histidine kinase
VSVSSPQIHGKILVLGLWLLAFVAWARAAEDTPSLIKSAIELRKAKIDKGDSRHRVDITAVVIRLQLPLDQPDRFTAQDETGGFSAFCAKRPDGTLVHFSKDVQAGMRVRVKGYAVPGSFGNALQLESPPQVEVLGPAELPPFRILTREDILSGAYQTMRAEARGVLRSVDPSTGEAVVSVQGVRVTCSGVSTVLKGKVGARVRVRGTFFVIWNSSRQALGARVANRWEDHSPEIEVPAGPPESIPLCTSRELFGPSGEMPVDDRVRLRGIVLFQRPDGIYLRDEGGGILVACAAKTPLNPGDLVEVLGFPKLGELAPTLEDATVTRLRAGTPPQPLALQGKEVLADTHEADLISVQARLMGMSRGVQRLTLLLKRDEQSPFFTALLDLPAIGSTPMELEPGALLEVRGICSLSPASKLVNRGQRTADNLTLLLRSPEDIRVLKPAPWWTVPRILIALGSMVTLAFAAGAWAAMLRHRVNLQTEIIRAKVGRESVHEDRLRIARELHDTLAQELHGISRQAQAIVQSIDDPERARAQGERLQELIRISRHDARNAVWDLRDPALLSGDLASALLAVTNRVTLGGETQVEVKIAPSVPRRLPRSIEGNLLRVVQEAVANAVVHGRATNVRISMDLETQQLRLGIVDDGCGCAMEDLLTTRPGHFGVHGMRERIEKLDGQFLIESGPGDGTRINAVIPMPDEPADHSISNEDS